MVRAEVDGPRLLVVVVVTESTHFVIDTVCALASTPPLLDNCITSFYHSVSNPHHRTATKRTSNASSSTTTYISCSSQLNPPGRAIHMFEHRSHTQRTPVSIRISRHMPELPAQAHTTENRCDAGLSSFREWRIIPGRWTMGESQRSGLGLVRGGRKRRGRRWRAWELTCAFCLRWYLVGKGGG